VKIKEELKMAMDLKNIIERIKEEGVDEAQKKAGDIIDQAESKASETIAAAEEKKKDIIAKAKEQADKFKASSEEAMRQASRDVLLGLRENIVALFDKVVKRDVAKELSTDVLKEMIIRLVEKFKDSGETEVEILLSEKDKAALEETLFEDLKKEMKKGVELKASSSLENGFRIGEKEGNAYYDFTDEAIEEAFKTYLNKKLTEILTPGKKDAK
jgi:V/A-type H+-transporting ATPase subunit E